MTDGADVVFDPIQVEQALLGALLHNLERFDGIAQLVNADDFSEPVHVELFARLGALHTEGRKLDLPLVRAELRQIAGAEIVPGLGMTVERYIARLYAEATSTMLAPEYARTVRGFADRRRLADLGTALVEMSRGEVPPHEIASDAIDQLDAIVSARSDTRSPPVWLGEAAEMSLRRMQHAMQNPGVLPGIPTGLQDLDTMTGGLQRGELIVCAGRPGMGKTALAVTCSRLMAATGTVGLFFSLEMGSVSIADRALADMTFDDREPIEYERIGRGLISDREAERLIDARRAFKDLPLKIDEQPNLSFAQIASRARKWAQRLERKGKRLGIVWVDHMHIVRPSDRYRGNRTAEVSETSAALKALAKELDIPVVALAQLSREVERSDDKRPQLFHLRDSGSIEQDADLICFVFREAYYVKDALTEAADDYTHIAHLEEVRNLLEVIVAKHRNGPTGIVRLFCNIECNAIRNAAPSSFDRAPARAGRAT